MKLPKNILAVLILPALLAPLSASDCDSKAKHQTTGAKATIVDVAVGAGQFKTLAAALVAADLVDVLKTGGPFTVFAPTNDAFKAVPAATMDDLAKHPEKLKAVLSYHVVMGMTPAAAVKTGNVKSLEGSTLALGKAGDFVTVESGAVVTADLKASNGVIHTIDTVLLPPKKK